jgi:hypothetical protein
MPPRLRRLRVLTHVTLRIYPFCYLDAVFSHPMMFVHPQFAGTLSSFLINSRLSGVSVLGAETNQKALISVTTFL